jgi:hypothetical protein
MGSYIILRNHDIGRNLQSGGDLDILVEDLLVARLALVQHFGELFFAVCRSYVEGYFYCWGHVDMTPRVKWRRVVYIENSGIFESAEVSGFGFPKPRLAHEADETQAFDRSKMFFNSSLATRPALDALKACKFTRS